MKKPNGAEKKMKVGRSQGSNRDSNTPPKYQVFSEDDAFFAWTFVKRRTLWQTLLSFFWPFLTLAICFFPVYPHQVKLLILYPCAGVLLLILCVLLLRAMIFCALWMLLGYHVWFFPNILAEEATIKELFQFWPQKDDGKQPEWKVRIFYENVAVVVILLLRRYHASDEAATARDTRSLCRIELKMNSFLAVLGRIWTSPLEYCSPHDTSPALARACL